MPHALPPISASESVTGHRCRYSGGPGSLISSALRCRPSRRSRWRRQWIPVNKNSRRAARPINPSPPRECHRGAHNASRRDPGDAHWLWKLARQAPRGEWEGDGRTYSGSESTPVATGGA
jgi:hypothetical protein